VRTWRTTRSSCSRIRVSTHPFLTVYKSSGDNKEDNDFDNTVGVLQDILLDQHFEHMQKTFCNENCMHFEPTEENKLVYTDIFKKYHEIIESFIT